jgi:hypothetical protein
MPNHFILIEDPDDPSLRRVSEYTPAEMSVCFSATERARMEQGGTIRQPQMRTTDRLYTDMLAFIDLARQAQEARIRADLSTGESPLRRALREGHLRHQHGGAGG